MTVLKPRCVELEDYYYEALAFSRHSINLELDEENMKPEKATMAARNAGINRSTMKMKKWYQGSARVSDKNSLAGDRPSYQARELVEDDDERLAMRQRDMPPPVPERDANPKIRDNRAVQDFQRNSEKMHRATHEGILFNNMGSFNRKSEFRKAENMHKPFSPREVQRHRRPTAVTSQRILVKHLRACDPDGRS